MSEPLTHDDDAAIHTPTSAIDWRESYYVNFFDSESNLHGLFWQGVRPNAGFGEAVFVLFDGHTELIRSINMHVPVAADIREERMFLGNNRWECVEPWEHWRAQYSDGVSHVNVDWRRLTAVCDWEWGPDAKRYEHAGRVHVEGVVGGRSISFDGFGQRDRAWGRRNYAPIDFSWWWVAQYPDEVAVQAYVAKGSDGSESMKGYLHIDGETRSIASFDVTGIRLSPHGGPPAAAHHRVVDDLGRELESTSCELLNPLTFGTDEGGSQLTERDPSENSRNRMYLSFLKFVRSDGVAVNGMIDNNLTHRTDGNYPTEIHVGGVVSSVLYEPTVEEPA
jgi:hypothetical protein